MMKREMVKKRRKQRGGNQGKEESGGKVGQTEGIGKRGEMVRSIRPLIKRRFWDTDSRVWDEDP